MITTPLREAMKHAGASEHRWALHAAVIYRGRTILATGQNFSLIHAEADAMANFKRRHPFADLRRLKLLSIRLNRSGELRMAKPCSHCQKLLRNFGIKLVVYSTSQGTLERMKL